MRSYSQRFLQHLWLLLSAVAVVVLLGLVPATIQAAPPEAAFEFDGTVFNESGLTATLPGTALNVSRLDLEGGALVVQASPGDLLTNPPQENAVGAAYISRESYSIGVRILGPQPFNSPAQLGGLFIAENKPTQQPRNYIRLAVSGDGTTSQGGRILLSINDNGKLRTLTASLAPGALQDATSSLDLFLTIDHSSNRVTVLYRVNSDGTADSVQALTRNLPRWMRAKNNQSVEVIGGVITSSPTPMTVRYDWLRVLSTPVIGLLSGFKDVDQDGIDSPVMPGAELNYTVGITNNGSNGTFRIVDPIPPDTTYVADSATATRPGVSFDAASDSVIWEGNLNAGESVNVSFAVTVSVGPLQSATISNVASAVRLNTNFPAVSLGATTLIAGTPDLSGSTYGAAPAVVSDNQPLTFTLTLVNDGALATTGTTAQLSIPANTAYVPNSATASSGDLVIGTALNQLFWSADGPLAAGSQVTISFQATPNSGLLSGTPITSQATIDAAETLPVLLEAAAAYSAPTPVSFSGLKQANLQQARPGDTIVYDFTIRSGATPAELELLDPLPADVGFVSLSQPSVGVVIYNPTTRQVRWAGNLAANQTVTFTLSVTVNATNLQQSRLVNNATLGILGQAPALLLSATTNLLGVPSAAGSTYIATPDSVAGGEVATFALNIYNSGTAAAAAATAEITLPAGLRYVADSAQASSGTISYNTTTGRIQWSAGGPLSAGTVVQVIFQAQADADLQAGRQLSSTATIELAGSAPFSLSASVIAEGTIGEIVTLLYLPTLWR